MNFYLLGFLGIILMNASALPQIYKIWKTRKVKDLTLYREVLLLIGCSCYLAYGIWRKDPVIIASNIWAIGMFLTLIFLIIKNK